MSDDICGVTCGDGTPCQNPAGENGFCWLPSHNPDIDEDDGRGRPEKLTHERQENIASMIEDGHSISAAARSNNITVQTFFNWMERGTNQDEGIYGDFFERITRARGQGEKQYLDAIKDIAEANDDTATLMTLLKSRYPDAWGDAKRGEQTGGVNVFLEAEDTTEIDPDTLEVKED